MLAETQETMEIADFSTIDLIRSMLRVQGIDYEVDRHGKLMHLFTRDIVIVVSEWVRPLDTRTLFNLLRRVEGRAKRVLLVTKELSGHARETIIRRKLPVVLIPENEIMSILDYI